MNTPCWEAGGWTALVGGNPTERIGRSRVNDIEHDVRGRRRVDGPTAEVGGKRAGANESTRYKWAGAHAVKAFSGDLRPMIISRRNMIP